MRTLRKVAVFSLAMYLGAGLFAGLLMQRGIPALNATGVVLIGVTWPNQIRCARVAAGCEPIPEWMSPYIFSFGPRP